MTPASRGGRPRAAALGVAAAVALSSIASDVGAQGASPPAAAAPAAPQPAASPLAAPPTAPAPPAARTAGRGAVVVALGAGAEVASRVLARDVYGDTALRPSIDEPTAQVLTGGAPAAGSTAAADLAALRAALDPDPGSPATRRALESLSAELGAAAILAVYLGADGTPRARLVRSGTADAVVVDLVARVDPSAPPPSVTWPGALAALHGLMPAPPAAAPATLSGPEPAPGPRAAARPTPARPAAPADNAGSSEFYERPWFWVAVGAFAAAGLTALVVAATTSEEEPSDSVRFRATIPESRIVLP